MTKENKGFSEDAAAFCAEKRGGGLKVRKIGNSLGVVFPKETLAQLRVGEGDELYVIETPDGIELRAYDPEIERQLDIARKIARRYRNTLRELAK